MDTLMSRLVDFWTFSDSLKVTCKPRKLSVSPLDSWGLFSEVILARERCFWNPDIGQKKTTQALQHTITCCCYLFVYTIAHRHIPLCTMIC